jgi:hypothetical protein
MNTANRCARLGIFAAPLPNQTHLRAVFCNRFHQKRAFHQPILRFGKSMTSSPCQSHTSFNALLRSFGTALGCVR